PGPAGEGRAPDGAAAVVAVEVRPGQRGRGGPPIAEPARDRAAEGVRVLEDGQGQPRHAAAGGWVVAVEAFHDVPAVVLPSRAARRLEVDLLVEVLSHVADEEIAREPVE